MSAPVDEVVVVTGASRGLGAAIAERLLSPSRLLVCVARAENGSLAAAAAASGAALDYRRVDLADAHAARALASSLVGTIRAHPDASRFVLINNAGVVEPIGPVESLRASPFDAALQVNLASLMLLSAAFLEATDALRGARRILNISSGAARHPIAGWSAYCTAKAGVDMFTRCIVAEQAGHANPARACSLAPGVLDTGMQATIRTADFPSIDRFRKLKASGELGRPGEIAARIVAYLARPDFGERTIDDIRDH